MNRLLVLLLLIGIVSGQELTKERLWTGTNGKTFCGIFIRSIQEGHKVEIASSSGQVFSIALENLSGPDRKLIETATQQATDSIKPASDAPAVPFKPLAATNRVYISKAPNKDDGFKWPNSVTQAAGSFIYWWDLSGVVEIPRRGDAEKKCDWLTGRLKRKLSPRNLNLASGEELMEGMAHYFESELKDKATFRFHQVADVKPADIAEFTKGADACFLNLFNDGWGIWFPVIDLQGDDVIRVAHEGKILMLKWTPPDNTAKAARSGGRQIHTPTLEVVNKNDAPSHWAGDELVFKVSGPMVICRPYVFAVEGKSGSPPADPDFDPQESP